MDLIFRTIVGFSVLLLLTRIIGKKQLGQLRKLRLNMDDLSMLLNSVFSILDVEYAIMEPNGELSILKTPNKDQVIRQDLQIDASRIQYLQSEITSDGNIVHKNLTLLL